MTDMTKKTEGIDPEALFAQPLCDDIFSCKYASESYGGWGHDEYWLHGDFLSHRYIQETRYGEYNSHGTDFSWESSEKAVDRDEAVRLLEGTDLGEASRRFQADCARAYESCTALLADHLPDLSPEGLVYNNRNTTILRAVSGEGRASAVKICRIPMESVGYIRRFCQALEDSGGSSDIIPIQRLVLAAELPGDECIAIIQMPLMHSVFLRRKKGQAVDYEQAQTLLDWHICIARALAKIHSLGFLHHDIRPENIMVDDEGRVMLADLCSIRPLREQYKGRLQFSSMFCAPELASHAPYGPDADVFAWGRTVLYSVCGMPCDPAGKPASVWLQEQDGYYEYHYQSQGHGEQRTCLFDLDERAVNMLETSVIAQAAEPWDRYSGGQALLAALERGSGQPEAYVRPDAG